MILKYCDNRGIYSNDCIVIIPFNFMVSLVSFLCTLYTHKVIACQYKVGMLLSFYRRDDLPKVTQLKGSDRGLEGMIPVGLSL